MNFGQWFENDVLWERLAPFIFSPERLNHAPIEADQLVCLLGLKGNESILDLCCGDGHFAIELARRGFAVTGVDRTKTYLLCASERASLFGAECKFLLDDVLHFRSDNSYDVIVNLYYSFGYHQREQQDQRIMKNVYHSLRSNGTLVLDLLSRDQILCLGDDIVRLNTQNTSLTRIRSFNQSSTRVLDRWILEDSTGQHEYHTSTRMYSPDHLTKLLRQCGFYSIQVYGGIDGRTYDAKNGRLVIVANKRAHHNRLSETENRTFKVRSEELCEAAIS